MKGFVHVQSLKLVSLLLVGSVGLSSAVGTPAADKVWLDKKALDLEVREKFKSTIRVILRDDKFSFVNVVSTLTEQDGLQIRCRCASLRDHGGVASMFWEFDKTGKLITAKTTINYGGKTYTPKAANVSSLKLARNEPRMSLIEKMADTLQANVKSTPIVQKGNVRTPDFSGVARYTTVLVAKHVWFGPKVTDHRTGAGGREDRRGDGGR